MSNGMEKRKKEMEAWMANHQRRDIKGQKFSREKKGWNAKT